MADVQKRVPKLDAGELRHRITFLEQQTVIGPAGSQITWVPGNPPLRASAKIESMRAVDVIRAGLDVSQVYMVFTMRYRPDLVAKGEDWLRANMRIQGHAGDVYTIQALDDTLQRKTVLQIRAIAISPKA